jgi:signal transduction histidine kinase
MRVLLLDANIADHETTAALIRDTLDASCVIECVGNIKVGLALVAQDAHELYFVRLGHHIHDALELIRAAGNCRGPIIALADSSEDDVDVRALNAGAADCIAQPNWSRVVLARSIRHALARQQMVCRGEHRQPLLRERDRLVALQAASHLVMRRACHDVRSPLTVIKTYSSILLSELVSGTNVDQARFLRKIMQRVDDLDHIVDNILDSSKLASDLVGAHREAISLEDLIEELRRGLQQKAAASESTLKIRLDEALPLVFCDRVNIGHVIHELVGQACKAAGGGGTVEVWVRHQPEKKSVLIGVTDDRAEISNEDVASIFDPVHRQRKFCGEDGHRDNLALHVVSEMVRINLGKLSVTAHPRRGSTSALTVPVVELDRILAEHVGVLASGRQTVSTLSVVLAAASLERCERNSREIAHRLWSELRACDLVIPLQPRHWALCLSCHEGDLSKIVRRVALAFDEGNRTGLDDPLPALTFRIVGTWPLCVPPTQVTQAVGQALSTGFDSAASSHHLVSAGKQQRSSEQRPRASVHLAGGE